MIQIKKLKRPNRKSGKPLLPGKRSVWKQYGVEIINLSAKTLYVDSVTPKKKRK